MPYHWTRISTGTAPGLKNKNAAQFKQEVRRIAQSKGARADEVYFDAETKQAYAMIFVPGDLPPDVKDELDGTNERRYLAADEMPADWKSGG